MTKGRSALLVGSLAGVVTAQVLTINVPEIGSLDAVSGRVTGLANANTYKACVLRESRSTTYDGDATSFVNLNADGSVSFFDRDC